MVPEERDDSRTFTGINVIINPEKRDEWLGGISEADKPGEM